MPLKLPAPIARPTRVPCARTHACCSFTLLKVTAVTLRCLHTAHPASVLLSSFRISAQRSRLLSGYRFFLFPPNYRPLMPGGTRCRLPARMNGRAFLGCCRGITALQWLHAGSRHVDTNNKSSAQPQRPAPLFPRADPCPDHQWRFLFP